MILDTDFLIDVMDKVPEAVEKLNELFRNGTPMIITAVSIFELFTGLGRSSKPTIELEKIHRVLQGQARWPLDDASAEQAGRIHGTLIKEGTPIQSLDAMISAIALQHHEPVLTRNVKHFSLVPNLKVETY